MSNLFMRLWRLRRSSLEAGIATVEYLATALIASALIGVMVTVPVAAEPNARDGFKNAICKVFEAGGIGGGCSTGESQNGDQEHGSTVDPNDKPPVCSVNKSSEKNSVTVDIKFFTAEGEFTVQKETMSDDKIKYTVVGGVGGGVEAETPIVGAEAGVGANAKVSLGDTWIYDPNSEEGKSVTPEQFEQSIREYAGWNVADKFSNGAASSAGNMFHLVPPEPRAPDTSSQEFNVGVDAHAKVGETIEGPGDSESGAEVKATVGADGTYVVTTNNKDGSSTYSRALAVNGGVTGKVNAKADGYGVSVKGGVEGAMKDTVSATYDKNGKLTKIRIQQAREHIDPKISGSASYPGGGNAEIGDKGKLYTVTTADMDVSKMSYEQQKIAEEWLKNPVNIAPDLDRAMNEGLPEDFGFTDTQRDFAQMLWQNSQLGQNVYTSLGVNGGIGNEDKDKGLGLTIDSSISEDQLVAARYAKPANGSKERVVVDNTDCLN